MKPSEMIDLYYAWVNDTLDLPTDEIISEHADILGVIDGGMFMAFIAGVQAAEMAQK